MKKLLYACFAALMLLLSATGFTRAQLALSFTDLYGDQYGKYVPFHAKLTSNGVEQQNFELYYATGGAIPSKAACDPNSDSYEPNVIKVVATNGIAEIILNDEMAPYFEAVAYLPNDTRESNRVKKSLTSLNVEAPSFNPPAPRFGKAQVPPNTVVKIVDEAGGADIYYSIDGETEPIQSLFGQNPNVFKYDDAVGIKVTKDVNIRAIAFKSVNGNIGGSDMARGGFEMDNKPQVQLALDVVNGEWTIGQAAPVLTVNTFNDATLGTSASDVAVKLDFTITGVTWTQIITASGTPLDMAKAVQAAQEDYCHIDCSLVKGNATNTVVNNIPVTPMVLGFQIEVPGEPPAPVIFTPSSGTVLKGTEVTLSCATEDAEIYYIFNKDDQPPTTKYTKPLVINSECVIYARSRKNGKSSVLLSQASYKVTNNPDEVVTEPEKIEAPTFTVTSGEVEAGTTVTLQCITPGAKIYYTVDGSTPTSASTEYTAPITINEAFTLKAIAIKGEQVSAVAEATYTIKGDDPSGEKIELWFNPESGSELYEGREVNIIASKPDMEIFYMMFSSEEEARSAEWIQDAAQPYNFENKPMPSKDANTIKASYARPGNMAIDNVFFYATYVVKDLSDFTLTFNPASGSEVKDGTVVTVTANHSVEIFYNVYADKAAADADPSFVITSKTVEEDGMPVITQDAPFLRCGIYDGAMVYFDAVYTIKDDTTDPDEPEKVELTFDPASGSEVEDGTVVTVTANRDVDIYYNVYADKLTADADDSFILTAYMVSDGMPMITKGKPFLRCGVFDGKMVYFDATYTFKTTGTSNDTTAVETEFERTVGVYPNPSDGTFNIEVPVVSTVEIFAANGVLFRRLNLNAGVTTVNINRSGIYFLRIAGEGRTAIKRIIIR